MTSLAPETPQGLFARVLAAASSCFLLIFLAAALAALLPIRFVDPGWQLGMIRSLVDNSSFPLISLVLLHFASHLEPANGPWQARCTTFRYLAISATLGFLLIVPLQAFATWKAIAASEASTTGQQRQVTETFGELREAIRTAPTLDDLQDRLQQLNGPPLQAADLNQPLPQLRQQLLAALQQAESTVKTQLPAIPPERKWDLIKESVRIVASALAFAFAFGTAACRPGDSYSLWPALAHGLTQWRKARQIAAMKLGQALKSTVNANRRLARQAQLRKTWKTNDKLKRKREASRRQQRK